MADAAGAKRGDERTPTGTAAALLVATGTDDDPEPYRSRLAACDHDDLAAVRDDRERALAFWTNLYNAGTQLLLERRPGLYDGPLRFLRFFRAKAVTVAGRGLGLDAIEQGVLRGGRSKYGLGYLPRLPRRFERRYAVDCDPRIHFALNCGATSCPPIAAYTPEEIGSQLDLASESYLRGEVEFDRSKNVARVPRLCLWYYGDFRGRRGIRSLLRRYGVIGDSATPRIRYKGYDWSLDRGNFRKSLSLSAEEPRESATNGRPIDD